MVNYYTWHLKYGLVDGWHGSPDGLNNFSLKKGTVRKYSFNQGEARDMVMYSILPTDFMPTTFPFPTFSFIFRATLLNFHNLFVYYFVLLPISYNHIYLREIMNWSQAYDLIFRVKIISLSRSANCILEW